MIFWCPDMGDYPTIHNLFLFRLPVGRGGVINSPRFWFFFPCRKSAHRSWVTPLCIVWATTLNSISSGICHQNTQFNMYTTTSKQQEGCTFEDSHPKCFITTNSTAKFSRGAVNRGDVHVLRASYTKVNSNTVCNYFNFIWHNGLSLLHGNCSISLSLRSEKITWQSRDPWRLFAYVDQLMLAVSILKAWSSHGYL